MTRARLVLYGSLALMVIGISLAAATGPAGVSDSMAPSQEESCPAIQKCPALRGKDGGAAGGTLPEVQTAPTDPRLMA
jgi:hypothetical protein